MTYYIYSDLFIPFIFRKEEKEEDQLQIPPRSKISTVEDTSDQIEPFETSRSSDSQKPVGCCEKLFPCFFKNKKNQQPLFDYQALK
jgi:hypothetical protein